MTSLETSRARFSSQYRAIRLRNLLLLLGPFQRRTFRSPLSRRSSSFWAPHRSSNQLLRPAVGFLSRFAYCPS